MRARLMTQMSKLRGEGSDLRERVLSALTIAFGRRLSGAGSELWAEVPRPKHRL
jgi:hypothetical protein